MNKVKIYCPFCDKEHDLNIITSSKITVVNDEEVVYDEKCYLCEETNERFMSGSLLNQNILNAKDIFRQNHNLLTSKDIKSIREKYNLSQADLSLILGWGEVTITRYETKEVQNINYDNILRQINDDPFKLYDYFKLNRDKFECKKQYKIEKKIINATPSNFNNDTLLEDYLIKKHFSIKEVERGNQLINFNKILAVIKVILENKVILYKTKLAKLLWYIDMIHYKKYKTSITGLAYKHMPFGAYPIELDTILNSKNINMHIIEDDEDNIKCLIKDVVSTYQLKNIELESIKLVVEYFKNYTSKQLVNHMHNEKAYLDTNLNDIISFEYAKYIEL